MLLYVELQYFVTPPIKYLVNCLFFKCNYSFILGVQLFTVEKHTPYLEITETLSTYSNMKTCGFTFPNSHRKDKTGSLDGTMIPYQVL